MLLWTIQPSLFYSILRERGSVQASYRYIDKDHAACYRWMAAQMLSRGVSSRLVFPIWAWFAQGGSEKRRPDLRRSWWLERGTAGVRIEFEIAQACALLSQFEMWVMALRGAYVPLDDEEDRHIDAKHDAGTLTQEAITRSWARMFDLSLGSPRFWGPVRKRAIQACVPSLHADQIRGVDRFVAR